MSVEAPAGKGKMMVTRPLGKFCAPTMAGAASNAPLATKPKYRLLSTVPPDCSAHYSADTIGQKHWGRGMPSGFPEAKSESGGWSHEAARRDAASGECPDRRPTGVVLPRRLPRPARLCAGGVAGAPAPRPQVSDLRPPLTHQLART